ncbi:glycosyltransferase family 25 protein [Pelagibaculum spongiae]|uniref:Glycosyl transferase family 25 n=1 Tax=Pelagibaculum spongiae TaxID=2080658 RepID=A0A2V1GZ15_9GAMM|nr:glycosyltransferase family 25 protein [Pelagibaculum spongiae]PVZ70214.1 glycosyl transferase family 25 [Pelagibaculum spongiae]
MKAIVINLESALERREFQLKQAKALGFELEIFSAVTCSDISPQEYQSIYCTWERPMLETEVACFKSHYKVWQQIAQAKQPILVLEDDAILVNDTSAILQNLMAMREIDHVSLEARGRKKILSSSSHPLFNQFVLRRLFQDRTGAAAYVLWPSGARKLLDNVAGKAGLADAIICASYNLNSYQVEPAAAIQADRCDFYNVNSPINPGSTINLQSKPLRADADSSLKTYVCKLRRINGQLRMARRQLTTLGKSKRRMAEVKGSLFFSPSSEEKL